MINKQEKSDKQLLAWERERKALRQRLNHPPVHLLPEPIQQGWRRQFFLTDEARWRPDAPTLTAILAEINSVAYFWRRDFQPSRRATRRGRSYSTEQHLYAITTSEWERRKYPDAWHKYFRIERVPTIFVDCPPAAGLRRSYWMRSKAWESSQSYTFALAFRFAHLFVLRVERHWLTHFTEVEPEVVARHAEVEAYINRHNGGYRLAALLDHSPWRPIDHREHILRKLAVREMRAHLGVSNQMELPGAADAMPSPCPVRWRHAVGGVRLETIFAAVRPEILRHQNHRERQAGLTGHRHSGQGSQALASTNKAAADRERRVPARTRAVRAVPDGAHRSHCVPLTPAVSPG